MTTLHEALETVYKSCRQQLFTCALHVTRCPARAEDAIHEAFSRLLRMGRMPDDLKVYVFRAVRNAAIDQVTRFRKLGDVHSNNGAVAIFESHDGPADSASKREFQSRLETAIASLPEPQRDAVVFHLYGELTFKEIARLQGVPDSTVAARYYRALEKLRAELKE